MDELLKDYPASLKNKPYGNGWEHVGDIIKCLDIKIARLYNKLFSHSDIENEKKMAKDGYDNANEVKRYLVGNAVSDEDFIKTIKVINEHIESREIASNENNVFLPVAYIISIFALGEFEKYCFILALAVEFDSRYEKIYSYLQENVMIKLPTINLVIKIYRLLSNNMIDICGFISSQSFKYLFRLINDDYFSQTNLSCVIKLDKRIVDFVLNPDIEDQDMKSFVNIFYPDSEKIPELLANQEELYKICSFAENISLEGTFEKKVLFYLYGSQGIGKRLQTKHFCKAFNVCLMEVDLKKFFMFSDEDFVILLEKIKRETIIQQSIISFYNFDEYEDSDNKMNNFINALSSLPNIVFVLSNKLIKMKRDQNKRVLINIELTTPNNDDRRKLWNEISASFEFDEDVNFAEIANKFELTPEQIQSALESAYFIAKWNGQDKINSATLHKGCYNQISNNMPATAVKINPKFHWDDLILPNEQKQLLLNACNKLRYRHIVFDQWEFERKISGGKGISILLYGPPGTGKTMSAQVIANEMHLEVYKVNLSQVLSKYIGETEKNLQIIFDEASRSNIILFFDEADSLFSKRTDVKDSHDKYANIETSFLLQRLEEYNGISILATNFLQNIDQAFMRRLSYVIHFPFPDIEQRKQIWLTTFTEQAPKNPDINFEFLASRFELSGSNIKNCVVSSAFLAAHEDTSISMKHILWSIKYELSKIGKNLIKEDFEEYDLLF